MLAGKKFSTNEEVIVETEAYFEAKKCVLVCYSTNFSAQLLLMKVLYYYFGYAMLTTTWHIKHHRKQTNKRNKLHQSSLFMCFFHFFFQKNKKNQILKLNKLVNLVKLVWNINRITVYFFSSSANMLKWKWNQILQAKRKNCGSNCKLLQSLFTLTDEVSLLPSSRSLQI
jgi:fucose 4-O-acetylase-like acetyltransferase